MEKQHVALRRRCPSCPDFGVLLAQLQCPCRAALFSWKASRLPLLHAIFLFLALVCRGFSSSMLAMVRQHASFTSEADVLTAQAAATSQLNLLPAARLRLLTSQGWFTWRLLTRALGADLDLSEMDFFEAFGRHGGPFLAAVAAHIWTEICCRQHKKQACAAMWWSSMARPRIGGRCVQQLWPAPPILRHLQRTLRHTCTRDAGLPPCFLPLALRRTYGRRRSPPGARAGSLSFVLLSSG